MGKGKSSGFSSGGTNSFVDVFDKYGVGQLGNDAYNNRGIPRGVAGSIYRAYKNDEIQITNNLTSYIYDNMVGNSWTTDSRQSEPAIALRVAANALRSKDTAAATTAINEFVKREAATMSGERQKSFLNYVNTNRQPSAQNRRRYTYSENQQYKTYLKTTAKNAGVKVGNINDWDKIKKKLTANGVSFKERDEYFA